MTSAEVLYFIIAEKLKKFNPNTRKQKDKEMYHE